MLEVIKLVSRQLTRRMIFAYAFRWGAYGAVLAVLFALASKLIIPSFQLSFLISPLCIIAGLLIGAIIGIINRPTLLQTAIFLDEKLADKNYLSTFVECVNKQSLNPVEAKLVTPQPEFHIPDLTIAYKYSQLIIFLIAVIVLVIIQQTPVPTVNGGEIPNAKSQITNNVQISNIKTQVKTLQETVGDTNKQLLAKIERLAREIEEGTATPSLVLAKVNELSRAVQTLPPGDKDTTKLQALLDKLQEYYKISAKSRDTGFTRATESVQGGTSASGSTGNQITDRNQLNLFNPLTEVTPAYLEKLGEEALSKPYWPSEYNEVIKKYFTTTDEHR